MRTRLGGGFAILGLALLLLAPAPAPRPRPRISGPVRAVESN